MKALLALLFMMAAAGAQAGNISGVVRDEQGAPIQGTQVTLANNEGSSSPLSTASDAQGAYHFFSIPAGTYHLQASLSGFATRESGSISVSAVSANVTMDLTLTKSSAARPQFEAAGVRGLIDPGGYSASSNAAAASGLIKGIADIKRTGNDPAAAERISAPCSLEPALKRAVEEKPESVEANLKLGEFYLAHGQAAKAIAILKHVRSLDQGNQRAVKQLAEAYLQAGQFDAAERLLTPLTATPERLRLLARANEGNGNFAAAARDYQAAAEQDSSEENLFGAGYELILAGLSKDAEQAFQTGLKRYPQSSQLLIGLGSTQFLNGHSSESVQTLLRAAERNPADPRPYPFLAQASGVSPIDAEPVHQAFERFLRAAPNNSRASYYCALNLLQQRAADGVNDGRIEALLRHAILLDPELSDAHFQLGVFYGNRQDYQRALLELEAAVRLSPNLQQAHYRLALAYQQTGRKDLSAKEMQRFEEMQTPAGGKVSIEQFISVFAAPEGEARRVNLCPGDSP